MHASKTCCCVLVVGDRFPYAVLNAALTLINSCKGKTLSSLPQECRKEFLAVTKTLWLRLKCLSSASACRRGKGCIVLAKHEIAEAIFRLSMNEACAPYSAIHEVARSIFGDMEVGFQQFLLDYWEESPFIFKQNNLENHNSCFSPLYGYFHANKGVAVIDPVLQNAISCPPITSDELDIFSFLNDVRDRLGSPLLYGQDIRVVKTRRVGSHPALSEQREMHFFMDVMNKDRTLCLKEIFINDVHKCKEALQKHFTIALRGLELRIREVAQITDCLAMLFGQPSVGANLYLTPPGSQGLSRHYDDHCVFVCQLLGRKRWVVSQRRSSLLPRLYDSLGSLHDFDIDIAESLHHILQEGDILYIPRGCTHEAHTIFSADEHLSEECDGFSLHLTLAIEVEPPFEWEGFIHVALHSWHEKQKESKCCFSTQIPLVIVVFLLHTAVRVISNYEPIFRKACLVGSFSSEHLDQSHRGMFDKIIDKIYDASGFMETFRSMETELEEGKNHPFQWLSWLRHLLQEGNLNERTDFGYPFDSLEDLINVVKENLDDAEVAFIQVKADFCRQVVFEEVCKSYRNLLEKYRGTRKKYTSGMLALNSNW